MKNRFQDTLVKIQLATPPPAHMATTAAQKVTNDMDANVKSVVAILEAKGHCPVTKLVEASKDANLNAAQQAAVNKWLMEHAYAKPKAVEITGAAGGPMQVVFGQAEQDF